MRLALTKTLCQTKCGYVLISYTTDTFVELKKFKSEDLCKSGKPRPTLNLRLGYAAIQEGYLYKVINTGILTVKSAQMDRIVKDCAANTGVCGWGFSETGLGIRGFLFLCLF